MARGKQFSRGGAVKRPGKLGVKGGKKGGFRFRKPFNGAKNATPNKRFISEGDSDFAGLIFMCSAETKQDCFKYHVFGFPEAKKDIVLKAKKGMKLFLFDVDQKTLHGVYKASSNGGMNLVEEAFQDSEREFPAQIRFRIMKDCAPLEEESFKPVIKENYFGRNKFRCELSEEQVDNLIKIFRPLDARGLTKPKFARDVKLGTRQKAGGALHKGFSAGGVGSAGRNVAGKIRQLPPEYATSDPYVRSAYPDIARLDSDVLYAPKTDHLYASKVDALERRPYVLDPLVESSLRPLGVRGEWIQRRIPEGFYSDERLLPITRAEYAYDLPYPRDVLYDSRDRALYRPIAGLPLAYP